MSKIYSDDWMKAQGFLESEQMPVNKKLKEFSNT
jgi:hypothetical protein